MERLDWWQVWLHLNSFPETAHQNEKKQDVKILLKNLSNAKKIF